MYNFLFTILLSLLISPTFGQAQILLQNPSFEDVPRMAKVPNGWFNCGFPSETEPDIHAYSTNFFRVNKIPSDGTTFIGMVVRDNDTWESIGQKLDSTLASGKTYQFSIDLCRSEMYVSPSRMTSIEVQYTSPTKLRIWGGNKQCKKQEMLAESPLVVNTRWLEYFFVLKPEANYEFILLECYYKTPVLFPYNGNLLLDNASPIIEIPSEASDSIAILAPKDAEENEQDYTNLENFQSPTLEEVDSIDAAKRKWGTADTFTDPLRTFLQEMTIDFTANQFLGETKTQLIQLVEGVKKSSKYKTIVVGIMGKNKRQKELSQPFLNFMEEFNLTQEQIYIVKVNIGELDEKWVGKNQYYRIRLE